MLETYSGACHCRATRFEIDATIDSLRVCNCSICVMRGAMIIRVPQKHFRLLTPLTKLSVYKWGTETGADYFCKTCGILPFRKPSDPSAQERAKGMVPFYGWAVNARCLADIDLDALPVTPINGAAIILR